MTPAPPVIPVVPTLSCPAASRAWPHVFCVTASGRIIVRRWRP